MAKLSCFLVFLLAICLALPAFALDIYVDNSLTANCSDYDPGSGNCSAGSDQAYNTLTEVANLVVAGDNVLIRAGTYDELLQPANSGSLGSPITFQSYQGEDVVITGTARDSRAESHPDDPNYYYGPIWLEDLSNGQIYNNIVINNGGAGISLSSSWKNTIYNNTLTKNGRNGIHLYYSLRNTIS